MLKREEILVRMKPTIRDYRNSDWSAILDMIVQTIEFHISIQKPIRFESYTVKLLRNYLLGLTAQHRNGTGKFLVAVNADDQPVGFLFGAVDKPDKELQKCVVKSATFYELFVLPAYRGQHVATALITTLEQHFKQQGCQLIRLHDVHATNESAQQLYRKLGYVPRVIEMGKRV